MPTQLKDEELLEKYATQFGKLKFDDEDSEAKNIMNIYKREIISRISKNNISLLPLKELLSNESVINEGINITEIAARLLSEISIPNNKSFLDAKLIFCMDDSGSMGIFEKYMAKSFMTWNEIILKSIYKNVSNSYILHNTSAHITNEQEFYIKKEAGGTIISSGLNKVNEIINSYDYKKYDTFIFIISDGDNLSSDNENAIRILEDLQRKSCHITYFEINQYSRSSTLSHALKKVNYENFDKIVLKDSGELLTALQSLWDFDIN